MESPSLLFSCGVQPNFRRCAPSSAPYQSHFSIVPQPAVGVGKGRLLSLIADATSSCTGDTPGQTPEGQKGCTLQPAPSRPSRNVESRISRAGVGRRPRQGGGARWPAPSPRAISDLCAVAVGWQPTSRQFFPRQDLWSVTLFIAITSNTHFEFWDNDIEEAGSRRDADCAGLSKGLSTPSAATSRPETRSQAEAIDS